MSSPGKPDADEPALKLYAALRPLLNEWKETIQAARSATLANRVLELCGIELLLRQFTTPQHSADTFEPPLSVSAS